MEPLSIGSSPRRNKKVPRKAAWAAGGLVAVALVVFALSRLSSPGGASEGGTSGRRGTSESVTFFVVGDWGREGTLNQTTVADLMSKVAEGLADPPLAVFSTGDNMYPNGMNSSDDPLFERSFINVYNGRGLVGVPWYAVLGNHDYGDGFWTLCENDLDHAKCDRGPRHQLGDSLRRRDGRWNMPAPNYVRSFGNGLLDVFFLDTNPWIEEYRDTNWSPWNRQILLAEDWRKSLNTLDRRLSESDALVKIVVGHHPVRSNGDHGHNLDLVQHLEPLLNEHGVKVYFSGHDHDLEHLKTKDMGFHQVVSGAGSDCTRGFHGTGSSIFQYPWKGFVSATVSQDATIHVQFFTAENGSSSVHSFTA